MKNTAKNVNRFMLSIIARQCFFVNFKVQQKAWAAVLGTTATQAYFLGFHGGNLIF